MAGWGTNNLIGGGAWNAQTAAERQRQQNIRALSGAMNTNGVSVNQAGGLNYGSGVGSQQNLQNSNYSVSPNPTQPWTPPPPPQQQPYTPYSGPAPPQGSDAWNAAHAPSGTPDLGALQEKYGSNASLGSLPLPSPGQGSGVTFNPDGSVASVGPNGILGTGGGIGAAIKAAQAAQNAKPPQTGGPLGIPIQGFGSAAGRATPPPSTQPIAPPGYIPWGTRSNTINPAVQATTQGHNTITQKDTPTTGRITTQPVGDHPTVTTPVIPTTQVTQRRTGQPPGTTPDTNSLGYTPDPNIAAYYNKLRTTQMIPGVTAPGAGGLDLNVPPPNIDLGKAASWLPANWHPEGAAPGSAAARGLSLGIDPRNYATSDEWANAYNKAINYGQ